VPKLRNIQPKMLPAMITVTPTRKFRLFADIGGGHHPSPGREKKGAAWKKAAVATHSL
jgi:hypothetical protein